MSECSHNDYDAIGITQPDGSVTLHWINDAQSTMISRPQLEQLVEEANHFKRLQRALAELPRKLQQMQRQGG